MLVWGAHNFVVNCCNLIQYLLYEVHRIQMRTIVDSGIVIQKFPYKARETLLGDNVDS